MSNSHDGKLKGGLQSRHMTMISIAGVIGAALFIGSGKQIALAGPSVILAYLAGGILVFLVMRMLGEMAIAQPDTGSFSTYADRAIGRWAGFTIGWLYWYFWAMLMGWEAYVAGQILHSWFLSIPDWFFALVLIFAFIGTNLMNVKNYGEFEFWFGMVKVTAIVLFLVVGSLAVVHLWPFGHARGFSHLSDAGFMPNGPKSVVTALLGVMFAMIGAEVVTVAASESVNPGKEIFKAIRSVVWRIILFYVGSIFLVVCLVPYNDPALADPTRGSYTVALYALGIPHARLIVNCVVLTSVCSCFNSSLYTASRMLFSLAGRGDAHRIMAKTASGTGTPYVAVAVSSVFAFAAVYLMASSKMDLYDILMQTTGCVALLVYLTIAFCQLRMRQQLEAQGVQLKLKMWLFPWLTYAVIAFVIGTLVAMIVEGTYRAEVVSTSFLGAVIVIMGLMAQWFGIGKGKIQNNNAWTARAIQGDSRSSH